MNHVDSPIEKGTKVRICTTNGGEIVTKLSHDYRPTYPLTVEPSYGGCFVLLANRIRSIELVLT